MRKLLFLTCAMLFLCAGAVNAATIIPDDLDVDFRDWVGAYGQTSWTQDAVTATAMPQGSLLYQDGTDGLGILGVSAPEKM